jgi:hypothetical protein
VDFYIDAMKHRNLPVVEQAKALCTCCPVQEPCLEAGMSEKYGIWGGKTVAERRTVPRRLSQKRRKEAA